MIDDYYNTLVAVSQFTKGTAPNWEPSYALQDEFYCLIDKSGGGRTWQDQGSSVKIDANMLCDPDTSVTEKDRIKVIENHTLATADLTKYHKALGGSWTLTTSAAIGEAVIFYQATNNTGLARKADGDVYTIFPPIKNPNEMDRHLEILLQKVGE